MQRTAWWRSVVVVCSGLFISPAVALGQDAGATEGAAQPAAQSADAAGEQSPASGDSQETPDEGQATSNERQRELEAELAKTLTGASLIGQFNITGQDQPGAMREDRYDLVRVTRLLGDMWLFQVRIRYGDHDLTVPLTIPIKWAGETPVITVDQLTVPGLGTYDARVMIHRGHYAGTWSANDHGGMMIGRIERTDVPTDEPTDEAAEPTGEAAQP